MGIYNRSYCFLVCMTNHWICRYTGIPVFVAYHPRRGLFGTAYDGANAFERPKYGVQNIWNDHRGVMGAKQYGSLAANSPCGCCELWSLVILALLWLKAIWFQDFGYFGPDSGSRFLMSGDSYIILKDVRLRCTLSPQDSANLPARRQTGSDQIRGGTCEFLKGAAQAPFSVDV